MEDKSIPPFEVGDRVVCVDLSIGKIMAQHRPASVLELNQEYEIIGLRSSCCGWLVDVGVKNPGSHTRQCGICGRKSPSEPMWWFKSTRFRLIPPMYENVSHELAQEAIKEIVEVDGPIKILQNN